MYVNKIKNRITFKIKAGHYFQVLWPDTLELPGSTKSKISKDENGENMPHLEFTEVVLVYCNTVNIYYQQDIRILYTFVPNKSFGQLLDLSHENFLFLETFNLELPYIGVWFTDQTSK